MSYCHFPDKTIQLSVVFIFKVQLKDGLLKAEKSKSFISLRNELLTKADILY